MGFALGGVGVLLIVIMGWMVVIRWTFARYRSGKTATPFIMVAGILNAPIVLKTFADEESVRWRSVPQRVQTYPFCHRGSR